MQMTVREIAAACAGRLLRGDPETQVTSVSTDSRRVGPGALFVPIRGERTDAHAFLPAVFEAGAAAAFTQEHAEADQLPQGASGAWIAVEDTVEALRRTAAAYRSRFSIPVVGITGSVGKTTTKEMVALALSSCLHTMKTEGNQNSQIGLPLTLFRLLPEHEAAVVEMGMSDFGEMARLAAVARPQYAVMTNIGVSHIGQLGSRENIMAEKLRITDAFGPGSVLFVNGDDPLLATLREARPDLRQVWFGFGGRLRVPRIAGGPRGRNGALHGRNAVRQRGGAAARAGRPQCAQRAGRAGRHVHAGRFPAAGRGRACSLSAARHAPAGPARAGRLHRDRRFLQRQPGRRVQQPGSAGRFPGPPRGRAGRHA